MGRPPRSIERCIFAGAAGAKQYGGIGRTNGGWLGPAQMSTSLSPLLAPMLSSAAMRAVCDDVACLQNMLDFEAALARAEAAVGVIPNAAAGPITAACRAESFDLAALAEA